MKIHIDHHLSNLENGGIDQIHLFCLDLFCAPSVKASDLLRSGVMIWTSYFGPLASFEDEVPGGLSLGEALMLQRICIKARVVLPPGRQFWMGTVPCIQDHTGWLFWEAPFETGLQTSLRISDRVGTHGIISKKRRATDSMRVVPQTVKYRSIPFGHLT